MAYIYGKIGNLYMLYFKTIQPLLFIIAPLTYKSDSDNKCDCLKKSLWFPEYRVSVFKKFNNNTLDSPPVQVTYNITGKSPFVEAQLSLFLRNIFLCCLIRDYLPAYKGI